MALLQWDPSFSVKVARCDDDHRKLFAILNSLHDAMRSGKGSSVVDKVVQDLLDYTQYHFGAEEVLLERTSYPALAAHRVQHQEFIRKVQKFQQEVATSRIGQAVGILDFLKDWLAKHIKNTDQQYAAHLNGAGVH